MTKQEFENAVSCLKGTLAVEDMEVTGETMRYLRRIADGEDYRTILEKIKAKYTKGDE